MRMLVCVSSCLRECPCDTQLQYITQRTLNKYPQLMTVVGDICISVEVVPAKVVDNLRDVVYIKDAVDVSMTLRDDVCVLMVGSGNA
eukprot:jgi/Botrbrau1/22462/Bobra.0091s0064.1